MSNEAQIRVKRILDRRNSLTLLISDLKKILSIDDEFESCKFSIHIHYDTKMNKEFGVLLQCNKDIYFLIKSQIKSHIEELTSIDLTIDAIDEIMGNEL